MLGVKTKLRVHPLFFLVGVLSALTGDLLVFCAAALAALEHEFAHAVAAARCGFALDRIVLMPYGAVIGGDLSGMGGREMLGVLFAGPFINGATALFFVALWWLFPETYPYTDFAAFVSCSLFVVNLLPAYPLDGGRALRILTRRLPTVPRRIIEITCGVLVSGAAAGYFIYSCVLKAPAFTALAFCVLLVAGMFGKGGSYVPISFSREKSLSRGVEERRVVFSVDCPLRSALRYLGEERYLVLILYENGAYFGEMPEEEYLAALSEGDYSKTFRECMSQTF